jgi:hypothetical protein
MTAVSHTTSAFEERMLCRVKLCSACDSSEHHIAATASAVGACTDSEVLCSLASHWLNTCVASILLLQPLLKLHAQGRGDGGVCTASQAVDCCTDSSPATAAAARDSESLSPLTTALRDTAAAASSSAVASSGLQQPGAAARSRSLGTQGAAARAASLQRSSDDVDSDVDSDGSDVSSDAPEDATVGITETGSYSRVVSTPSAASAAAAAGAAASSPSGWQGRGDADSGGVIGANGSNSAPQSPRERGGLAPDLSLLPLMRAKVSIILHF